MFLTRVHVFINRFLNTVSESLVKRQLAKVEADRVDTQRMQLAEHKVKANADFIQSMIGPLRWTPFAVTVVTQGFNRLEGWMANQYKDACLNGLAQYPTCSPPRQGESVSAASNHAAIERCPTSSKIGHGAMKKAFPDSLLVLDPNC